MKITNKKKLFSFKLYKYMMNKRKEGYKEEEE
jgi:hypothetical protein